MKQLFRSLKQRLRRPKATPPKLYYEGAHAGIEQKHASLSDSLIALEPRLMFDAAAVATGAEVLADNAAQEQVEQAASGANDIADNADTPAASNNTNELFEALATVEPPSATNEIIFVDQSVENYESLLAEINSSAEVVFINSDQDGVEHIADVLCERTDIDAVHIISHGDAGQLNLGNATLTSESMQGEYADELSAIADALSENGDILIYGCDFTSGEKGAESAAMLAELTGADIAGSVDDTGHASLGGDWELETRIGDIDTDNLEATAWEGRLAPPMDFDFSNAPVLESGTAGQVGAIYRVSNVATGFEALVEITATSNATLAQIDDTSQGVDRALQPEINGNAAGSFIEFNISFVSSGTNNAQVVSFTASALDVDSTLETLQFQGADAYTVESTTQLSVSVDPANNNINVIGNGPNFFPTSEANTNAVIKVHYTDVTSFTYRAGVDGNSTRQTALLFEDVTFLNPVSDDLPTAADDSVSSPEDMPLTFDPLANDDQGDTPTSVTSVQSPTSQGGSVTNNGDGTVTYNPPANFNGTDTFIYTITDNDGQNSTATVTVTVTPVNDAPVTTADSNTTLENTPLVVNAANGVLANDTDVDGDTLAVTTFTIAGNTYNAGDTATVAAGTFTLNANGSYTFTPTANFNGAVPTINYTISDGNSGTANSTLDLTVVTNTNLVATDNNYGGVISSDVTGNVITDDTGAGVDTDADSSPITVDPSLVSTPANGAVTVNPDGSFTYTPNNGFTGTDSFTYRASTPTGITGLNYEFFDSAPTGFTVDNIPVTAPDFTGNATDFDVQGLALSLTGSEETYSIRYTGYITINTAGTYNFQTTSDDGSKLYVDSVELVDNDGLHASQTVTSAGTFLSAGTHRIIIEFFENTGGDNLIVQYSGADTGGLGNFTNLSGSSVLVEGDEDTATVTIEVGNDVVAVDDAASTDEDTVITKNTVAQGLLTDGLLGNDLNQITPGATLDWNPSADMNALDNDGGPGTNDWTDATGAARWELDASVTLNISPGSSYHGITSAYHFDGSGNSGAEFDLLASGGSPDSFDDFTGNPSNKDATWEIWFRADDTSDEDVIFETGAGGDGTSLSINGDVLSLKIKDSGNNIQRSYDLSNFNGGAGLDPTAEFIQVGWTYNRNATGPTDEVVMYVNGQAVVTDTTQTRLDDWSGGNAAGLGRVEGGINFPSGGAFEGDIAIFRFYESALTAGEMQDNFEAVALEDKGLAIIAAEDDDADPITVNPAGTGSPTSFTTDLDATFTLFSDGTYTYDPTGSATLQALDTGDSVSETFTYTVEDRNGNTDTATLTITTTGLNDAPVNTVPGAQTVAEDTTLSFTGANTISVTDVEGNLASTQLGVNNGTLNVTLSGGASISAGANGSDTLTISGTVTDINATLASLSYQGTPDFNGSDTLTVISTDSAGTPLSDTDTVSITVNAVADGVADAFVSDEDQVLAADLSANDTHGAAASYALNTDAGNGSVIVNADGSFSYTPDADFNGSDSFSYDVTDVNGVTETVTVDLTVNAVADGVADAFVSDEDQVLAADLSANDTHGAAASYALNTDAGNGSVIVNADGSFSYTPDADFNGSDSFSYDVTDVNGVTETVTVDLTVNAVADGVADAFVSDEDQVLAADLSANDTHGAAASYALNTDAGNGSVIVNADGSFSYTPDADFNGSDSFSYDVTDVNGVTETVTVDLTVNAVADGVADAFVSDEDQVLAADLSTNDTHGAAASYALNTDAGNGSVIVNADGSFSYTPDADFNGSDSFSYDVTDVNGVTETVTVDLTVNAVADGVADAFVSDEDQVLAADLSANDTHGAAASYALNTDAGNGSVIVNADGSFSYTPDADFNGSDSFSYDVTDVNGVTETVTVDLTVNAVADGVADAFVSDEDQVLAADLSANDTHGAAASYALNTDAGNGSVIVNADGSFSYTPDADFNGSDSFSYDVTDVNGVTETVTVDLTVNAVADGVADAFVSDEDQVLAADLSANDTHGAAASYALNTDAGNGSVIVNADGSFSYTPDADFNGSDSFSYDVTDVNGVTETVTVDLTVNAVADGVADAFVSDEDQVLAADLSANDTHGAAASYALNTDAGNGSVIVNADGSFSYTPDADFNGSDSFSYDVTDVNGVTETVTVDLTVNAVADGVADAFVSDEDQVLAADLSANDTHGAAASYALNTDAGNGSVIVNADGSFSYTPDADFNGSDSFSYDVTDVNGVTETVTVDLTVNAVADGVADAFVSDEDQVLAADLSANDTHGAAASYALNTDAGNGSVIVNADGSFSYTPDADFNGSDSFSYDVTDVNGVTETVTVDLTVNADDAPEIIDATITIAENTSNGTSVFNVDDALTGTDLDTDGDAITYSIIGGNGVGAGAFAIDPVTGEITVNDSAQLDRESTTGFMLVVQATDGDETDTATITINLSDVDDNAPVVGGTFTGSVMEDTTLGASGNLTISDADVSANPAFPDVPSTPGDNGFGNFELVGGSWTYTLDNTNPAVQALDAGDNLTDSHTFTASDGTTQVVTISIAGVNEASGGAGGNGSAGETDFIGASADQIMNADAIWITDVDGGGGLSSDLTAEGAVLDAVEAADIERRYIGNDLRERAAGRAGLLGIQETRGDSIKFILNEVEADSSSVQDLSLFPLRFETADARDESDLKDKDHMIIHSTLRERALYLEIDYSIKSGSDLKPAFFKATLASGDPLPEWLSVSGEQDLISGEPPVGVESIALRIEVRLSDGTSIVRYIDVNVISGELVTLDNLANDGHMGGLTTFSAQLMCSADEFGDSLDSLVNALQGKG